MKQEMMGWHRHQLDHMQNICTSLQTDNHTSTSSLNFYTLHAVSVAQQCQSTERGQLTGIEWQYEWS